MPSGSPPMLTEMKGWLPRGETAWIACATSPLPVPFSPVMRTFASEGPTRAIELQDGPHGGRLGDDRRALLATQQLVLLLEPAVRPDGPGELDLVAHDREQPEVLPGLRDEVARAPAHGLHGELDVGPGRHDHDRKRGIERLQAAEEFEPLLPARGVAGVVQIHKRERIVPGFDRLNRRRGRLYGLRLVALVLQQEAQRLDDVGMVIGYQDAMGGLRRTCSRFGAGD
jgi:hypothetical protein